MDAEAGDKFIQNDGRFKPDVLEAYRQLRNPGLKSDFLRYLLLWADGGYYSDLDTKPAKPLSDWLSSEMRSRVRLIVATKHDDGVHAKGKWLHPVQFCQWMIAAAPEHPVLERMIQRALVGLKDLTQNTQLELLRQRMNRYSTPLDQPRGQKSYSRR